MVYSLSILLPSCFSLSRIYFASFSSLFLSFFILAVISSAFLFFGLLFLSFSILLSAFFFCLSCVSHFSPCLSVIYIFFHLSYFHYHPPSLHFHFLPPSSLIPVSLSLSLSPFSFAPFIPHSFPSLSVTPYLPSETPRPYDKRYRRLPLFLYTANCIRKPGYDCP